ncbi:hypothetical protein [Phenylobacterium sp.]|uniref:AbiTii domain-containing protein n=1 Tax=Phenylobacterium sp. TaxID=1871053 RepID=UPI002728D42B|nr:hypothetical protein [Phenylobacterium sp.]MDO8380161.1 hypothetical protein [Phenylobacterium sp.]
MPSIVEQIQLEAVSNEIPVSQLLRRMKLAALKLKLNSIAAWVDHEIEGYGDAPIPEYRSISGAPVAHNPYNGWIPIQADAGSMKYLRQREIRQSIASLEALLPGEGMIFFQYSPEIVDMLNRGSDVRFARMGLNVDRSTIIGLLDRVRGKALDWAIELESAGITGSGVSFTTEEIRTAASLAVNIGTFSGAINTGSATGSGARIYNASTDNSVNSVSLDLGKFDQLVEAVEGIRIKKDRESLLHQVEIMKKAAGTSRFLAAYQDFISAASDHITVVTPFLPWLGALIAAQAS